MKSRNLLSFTICFVICLFCSLLLLGSPWAGAADLEEIKKLDKEVLQQKKKIGRVKEGIRTHQFKVEKSKEHEVSLLEELEKIEQKIITQSKKLASLEGEMKKQEALTENSRQAMQRVLLEKETLQKHMEKRLAAFYRMGDIGLMNVAFSTVSLPELVSFNENFHFMLQYDHKTINDFKDKMAEFDAARKHHEQEKIKLAQAASEVVEQQKILAHSREEREKLLVRVQTETKLYQRAIEEMERATKNLSETLAKLEEEAARTKREREEQLIKDFPLKAFKKRKPASALGFAALKGKLLPPADGDIIKKFGKHTDSTHGVTTFANGIDIQTPSGSQVRAVYQGKIVYAGTLRGYGKLVIIDHGNHYYSLVSGIGEIEKKVGDQVEQHEKIGISSLHTGLLQAGLHFEIRHNTEVQDPLEWLDQSQLSFKLEQE